MPSAIMHIEQFSRAMRIGSGSGEPGREDTRRPRIIMEGPLVSDTTELLSDAGSASEDSPSGHSATDSTDGARRPSGRNGGDLSQLRVSDLQGLAQQLGISGTARMRKGDLVAAIRERQGGGRSTSVRGAGPAGRPAGTPESATRVAPAGAGGPRPLNQDTMEADTSIRSGIGGTATRDAGIGAARTSASAGQAGIGEDRLAAAAVQH